MSQGTAGRPVVAALVGLGYWGPNLLRVLVDDPGVTVKYICDRDADRLRVFARRHPAVVATTELLDVLGDPEVDAVLIATPVFTHFEIAAASLQAGKHTFVEKPLAPSAELADELIGLASSNDRVLMCGHTFLYSPPVRAVKGLLSSGGLGDVYFVSSSRVNLGLHQRDISVVWDLGPHDFSILLFWLDETPTTVQATGRDSIVSGIPDVAFVTMRFPSGVIAQVELSWLAPSKLRRTVVVGSEKMVVYEDGASEPVRVYDHGVVYRDPETFGQYHLSYRTGEIVSPKLDTYEPLVAELSDFLRAVTSGDRLRASTQLSREVVRVTEAAERSLRLGGVEVEVERREPFAGFARARRIGLAMDRPAG